MFYLHALAQFVGLMEHQVGTGRGGGGDGTSCDRAWSWGVGRTQRPRRAVFAAGRSLTEPATAYRRMQGPTGAIDDPFIRRR